MIKRSRHYPGASRVSLNLLSLLAFALILATVLSGCGRASLTAEEHLTRGHDFEQQGDLASAAIEYRNALQKSPESAEGRFRLGSLLLTLGDVTGAEVELNRARERGWDIDSLRLPLLRVALLQGRFESVLTETTVMQGFLESQVPEMLAIRGTAYLYRGKNAEAAAAFEQALAARPDLHEAAVGLARVQAAEGDLVGARHALERVLATDPSYGSAWELLGDLERQTGNLQEAEAAYSRALDHVPQIFDAQLKRALTRIDLEDFDGAGQDASALQRRFNRHPSVLLVRGLISYRQDRFADALPDFHEALAVSADHALALRYLGSTNARLGNLGQAEHYLRRYLSQAPESQDAILALASLYLQRGSPEEATRLLERSGAHLNTDNAQVSLLKTRVAFAAGDDDQGLLLLADVAQAHPESQQLQRLLGAELMRQGRHDEALDVLRSHSQPGDDADQLQLGMIMSALRTGDFERALAGAQTLREKHPDRVEPWNLIGSALLGMGRVEEARRALEDGLAIDPTDIPLNMNLGSLELRAGHSEAARARFQAVQIHHPGHPESALRLASLDTADGDTEGALGWLGVAAEARPDDVQIQLMLARLQLETGRPDAAIRTLQDAQSHHPSHPQVLFGLGDALYRTGRFGEAVKWFQLAHERLPDDDAVLWSLAHSQSLAGDVAGSEWTLSALLEQRPDHYRGRVLLVRNLLGETRIEDARPHIDHLLDSHPDRSEVLVLVGEARFLAGNWEDAVHAFKAAIERTPGQRAWVLRLAQAQHAASRHDAAESTLTSWLDEHPGDLAALHQVARWTMDSGRPDEALDFYGQILSLRPDDVSALNNSAWLLRHRDSTRALTYAERAASLAPDSAQVLGTLGVVLLAHDSASEAIEALRKGADLAPGETAIRYHLARAYVANGEERSATETLRDLLDQHDSFPEREEAQRLLAEIQ